MPSKYKCRDYGDSVVFDSDPANGEYSGKCISKDEFLKIAGKGAPKVEDKPKTAPKVAPKATEDKEPE